MVSTRPASATAHQTGRGESGHSTRTHTPSVDGELEDHPDRRSPEAATLCNERNQIKSAQSLPDLSKEDVMATICPGNLFFIMISDPDS